MINKKGQLTIFVIVAVIIVAIIGIYFLVRGKLGISGIPAELTPVFDYYESCIEQETRAAIDLAGTQGGYVEAGNYAPGSEYAPFSSQLNFLGFPIPYWYYVAGNGLIKEQVPSKADIEKGIADYVEARLNDCNFDNFYAQGFDINFNKPEVRVKIENNRVDVDVISNLAVSKGEESANKKDYSVSVNSKIGKFYDLAIKIYNKEKKDAFFDNFAADVLRLYTPVDGVEISCSGRIWKTEDVINNLKSGLEANIAAIKFKGNYYGLNDKNDKYYVVDLGDSTDENINLIYARNMPTKIEIAGENVDDQLMIASPVGLQEGLGILRFCYSPYHFVYDFSFPILIQIYNNEEIFQFPLTAIVDKNVPRQAEFSQLESEEEAEEDLCEFKTQDVKINIFDVNLQSVNANITYQCFNQRCRLGETINGEFIGKAPACFNGQLIIKGGGFADKTETFSSNNENSIDVIVDRLYDIKLDLEVGNKPLDGTAIISFVDKNGKSVSTVLPDVSNVKLSEGDYSITVYVYGNSSITIPASKKTQCQDIPRTGILGFFGAAKEKCFDIEIPETKIEYALRGGGKSNVYLLPSQLEEGTLNLRVDSLPLPKSLEELQYNYASFDGMGVQVE